MHDYLLKETGAYMQDILEKAIAKAIEGGLTGYWADRYASCKHLDEMEYLVNGNNLEDGRCIETLIFSHDFAKALWGDSWSFHLKEMVVAEDPINYLAENI